MPTAVDPSLNRRKLRLALKAARDKRGLTQRDAADALEWSLSKLIRIEAGTVSLSVTDLRAMLLEYGVEDPEVVADLEEAARGSKGQSWWSAYNDVISQPFNQYLGYESAANVIRGYHPSLIPGQLQISDYVTALFEIGEPGAKARQLIDLRLARQERVLQEDGPRVEVILDEAALRRQIGGPATMRRQLAFLKSLVDDGRATLRALPFTAGVHDSLDSSFFLLGFRDDEDVLYVSGPGGTLTNRDDRELVARYQECFEDLQNKALSQEDTMALFDDLIENFHRS
ncbi:helix-turn-helix transcriptional regulator [Streptomyces turgidiscabies]|uniref:Toxin-antitoxin system, antitoxin component, Xre family n=1 Tax=Streptomyces turgidiscabies (strain Car8) TaxID=698760 RepID=L7ER23_STRT8|nr:MULTISPECIES: helix-turn-helix transcriptional regulator [Streptomyces]ELP61359.1 toxin-antitoxin system, antitoxin component, Xre family [Streptomyces turgidiscabies Car8]MDX3493518.1 helix-turn-helix transcriptional regulator [Streptomyces turgidiscabies]GAQ76814.1 helix-turn-helix protein [Streptomyces turgidiscabies]